VSAPGPSHIDAAIALAERGRGHVEPGAVVGAVVAQAQEVVGEGWYAAWGGPHAEVTALQAAGDRARGADLFVSLEPCAHQGKTPPCTKAIVEAGIARVFYAAEDSDPVTAGKGPDELRAAGVEVSLVADARSRARRQNAPFIRWTLTKRPLVTAKWAMTLDGRLAARSGQSLYLTGDEALHRAHHERARCGAVMVGIGTVLQDDPALTIRHVTGPPEGPRRCVVDSQARLPLSSKLVQSAADVPVLCFALATAPAERVAALRDAGVTVEQFPAGADSRLDLDAVLDHLGSLEIQHLMVEGGSALLGSFFDHSLVDRTVVFVAGRVLGGADALAPVGGTGAALVADAPPIAPDAVTWEQLGRDLMATGWIWDPAAEPSQ
jgi:diaminohydroxyphosphoribosylaminopyrimidine deaminase/5-amino-6-(5-phosphoribosylamino)uracil reductase